MRVAPVALAMVMVGLLMLSAATANRRTVSVVEPLQPAGAAPVEEYGGSPPPPPPRLEPDRLNENGLPDALVKQLMSLSDAQRTEVVRTLMPPRARPEDARRAVPTTAAESSDAARGVGVGASPTRSLMATAAWQPTAAAAPWYFAGAAGETRRAREQLPMRINSGFLARDSPAAFPARAAADAPPVLTGTSWHWGRGGCARHNCSGHGVCVPRFGRCDCGPYWWGADCSIPVVTQKICVYNDSRPWFCDKPACVASRAERVTAVGGAPAATGVACVGNPLKYCPDQCHGRGACVRPGVCECYEGFEGPSCATPERAHTACLGNCSGRGQCMKGWCHCRPGFWGSDCSRDAAGRGPRCTARPCLYVYELPPRMNVLALKAEFDWRAQVRSPAFSRLLLPSPSFLL